MDIERIKSTIFLSATAGLLLALFAPLALAQKAVQSRQVNCHARSDSGIQSLVDSVNSGAATTIVIKGTCREAITVMKDDLTLLAHPDGGILEGSIDVIGAQRVVINGLRVTGSGDVVTARDNASIVIVNGAFIKSNGGSAVFATRSASVVMENATLEATGTSGCAAFIADGSALRMNGGNTLSNNDAPGFNCGTLSVYRNSTARIRGSGNTITNKNVVKGGPNTGEAGGVALDTEVVSSLRIDGTDAAVINGNVVAFNLSTIDLRKVVVDGGIYADGLNANVRLRGNKAGDVVVNGDVFPGGDSAVAIRNNGEVIINGNIDCSNGFNVRLDFEHFGPGGSYVDCFFPF